jgi:hypothetical protein
VFERVRRVELALGVPPSHYQPGAGGPAAEAGQGTEPQAAVERIGA